ncbi:hypothetical protein JCM8547_002350 [Rhodosporidiobolus lusitaniae]
MSTRKPLQPLPLDHFVRAALFSSNSSSSSSSRSSSPVKKPRMGDLLPSPFLSATSRSGPLQPLYERPPTPRRVGIASPRSSPARAMLSRDEEERLGDDEVVSASPRRLIDLFKQSAGPSSPVGGPSSATTTARRERSMPPPSPRRVLSPFLARKEDKEEEPAALAWSFYHDGDAEAFAPTTAADEDASMSSPDENPSDLHKENDRPPPRRRRSTSLLSQTTTTGTLAAPSPAPSPRPSPLPASTTPRTPPSSSFALPELFSASAVAAAVYSSYPFASTTHAAVAVFGESAASSFGRVRSEGEEEAEGALLPAFEAQGGEGGRKRQSLEQAGGEGKRARVDEGEGV